MFVKLLFAYQEVENLYAFRDLDSERKNTLKNADLLSRIQNCAVVSLIAFYALGMTTIIKHAKQCHQEILSESRISCEINNDINIGIFSVISTVAVLGLILLSAKAIHERHNAENIIAHLNIDEMRIYQNLKSIA